MIGRVCAAAMLIVTACRNDVVGTGEPSRLVNSAVTLPAWSADGRSIYYTNRFGVQVTSFSINSVDLLSGNTRELGRTTGWNTGGEKVRGTSNPESVFFSIASPSGSATYRILRVSKSGGNPEILASDATWPWFEVAANGSIVAYAAGGFNSDTLRILQLNATGVTAKSFRTGASGPVPLGVSPSGDHVVYKSNGVIQDLDLSTFAQRELWRPPAAGGDSSAAISGQIAWVGSVPHLLLATTRAKLSSPATIFLYDVDPIANTRIRIGSIPGALGLPFQHTWTGDRESAAAWVPVEVVSSNVERTTFRTRVFLSRSGEFQAMAGSEKVADESPYWMELDPTGNSLGFVLYGRLYASRL